MFPVILTRAKSGRVVVRREHQAWALSSCVLAGLMLGALWFVLGSALAQTPSIPLIQEWLSKDMMPEDQTWRETQRFTERQVPSLRAYERPEDWENYAQTLRKEILQDVVLRGAAQEWAKLKTKVEWFETIDGGDGYRIRKLRYEAVPGLWIPALLYEPKSTRDKVPVVLNVNGHDGAGKAAVYKQTRCIHQAKAGMLALNTEWLGMGQLAGTNYSHYRMNQLDLCGTSGLAPYYLAMKRALDVLLEHPRADSNRVAVTGLSGGGWQTIVISALDERVRLANPVAGYSSFRTRTRFPEDLGDSEQTPTDLATLADYTHLTALLAPRPALLTFNAKDDCCFASGHALEPLLEAAMPIYRLLGHENRLRTHVNLDPGDHNFGEDNRRALYGMLRDHFQSDTAETAPVEAPVEGEIKTAEVLAVPLPESNADFHSLAVAHAARLPSESELPRRSQRIASWQTETRERLNEAIRGRPYRAVAESGDVKETPDFKARMVMFKMREDWTVPGVELSPDFPKATVLLIHDEGKTNAAAAAAECLRQSQRVIVLDLFYFGECRIQTRDYLYALLVATIGERPLGLQTSQLNAVARWAKRQFSGMPLHVTAVGARSSFISLMAAAVEPRFIDRLDLYHSMASLREVIQDNWRVDQRPEWFCFGLLELLDIRQMVALVAPRPVVFHNPTPRLKEAMDGLVSFYKTLGVVHDPVAAPNP